MEQLSVQFAEFLRRRMGRGGFVARRAFTVDPVAGVGCISGYWR